MVRKCISAATIIKTHESEKTNNEKSFNVIWLIYVKYLLLHNFMAFLTIN